MEGEIGNFVRVWASIFASVSYSYAVARLVGKGFLRLIMFVPVVCLFLVLPFSLTSVHLGCPTVFFISWLANFKLLLLAFGNGPLSQPSLSLSRFICIACLPIKVQENQNPNEPTSASQHPNQSPIKEEIHSPPTNPCCKTISLRKRELPRLAMKAFILGILVSLAQWRESLNADLFLFCLSMYIYVGLDLMLGVAASICQVWLGMELETPFNAPYLSTSLRDFWGQRWNRVASDILRSAVYKPTLNYASRIVGQKWGLVHALLSTFLVSAVMHELILYYLGRTRPTFCTTAFFLIHGMILAAEAALKKKMKKKAAGAEFGGRQWPLMMSQLITGPLIFGFLVLTLMWLVLPEVVEYKADARALDEYAALGEFLKDLTLSGMEVLADCFQKIRSTMIRPDCD